MRRATRPTPRAPAGASAGGGGRARPRAAARAGPRRRRRGRPRSRRLARPAPPLVSEGVTAKKYLFTPGPTPVPPAVLAALAEPVVHHRSPDFRPVYERCLS